MRSSLFLVFLLVVFTTAQYDADFLDGPDDDPELDPVKVEEPGCPIIQNLKRINLKEILGQWHLPYMSKHYIRSMAKSMHGKYMKRSSLSRACIKINVNELNNGTPNNSDATISLHSKCPRTGSEWSLACSLRTPSNAEWYCNDLTGKSSDGNSYIFVVDTDGKSWALIVRCFPNNGMNWAIFSKVKELQPALVKSILSKVQSMGFKLNNVVEVPYSKCMTYPHPH